MQAGLSDLILSRSRSNRLTYRGSQMTTCGTSICCRNTRTELIGLRPSRPQKRNQSDPTIRTSRCKVQGSLIIHGLLLRLRSRTLFWFMPDQRRLHRLLLLPVRLLLPLLPDRRRLLPTLRPMLPWLMSNHRYRRDASRRRWHGSLRPSAFVMFPTQQSH